MIPDYANPFSLNKEQSKKEAEQKDEYLVWLIGEFKKTDIDTIKTSFSDFKETKFENKKNLRNFQFYLRLFNALAYFSQYMKIENDKDLFCKIYYLCLDFGDLAYFQDVFLKNSEELQTSQITQIDLVLEPYTKSINALIRLYENCHKSSDDGGFFGNHPSFNNHEEEEKLLLGQHEANQTTD